MPAIGRKADATGPDLMRLVFVSDVPITAILGLNKIDKEGKEADVYIA